ncbi:MAG: radical SAM protein [Alphaproteobacteria bacterium]|nr:radical SAM protein [Alphaproteobacteria bacterium]
MRPTTLADRRPTLDPAKFQDPERTATGEARAQVPLQALRTLWFNTGTLCNIACAHCYIESSPTNDRLAYLSLADVRAFLDEADTRADRPSEIGFTGGEPFLNPAFPAMIAEALGRGFSVLVLTNAMQPMARRPVRAALAALPESDRVRLVFRVSLDHASAAIHDAERGAGAFSKSLEGMRWLSENGFRLAVASRNWAEESEDRVRDSFAQLFVRENLAINARDPGELVIFPEMDAARDVPEITTSCWGILGKDPASIMCASSRMVVERQGAARPSVLSCTLLAYDRQFEMGSTLTEASRPVALNHPHCAAFCVLGGASCSAG